MARIGDMARVRVRVNGTMVDTHGVTVSAPLEEQVMLVWHTAHEQLAAHPDTVHCDKGVQGPLNVHVLVRGLFGLDDDGARHASSRIRQVLKKVGAARNILPGGQGTSPVWWISDTLPDNIVTVAQWVAAHPHANLPAESMKLSRTEQKLTPHEVGENRDPAPVMVSHADPEPERSTPRMEETETSDIVVDIEGPADRARAARARTAQEWVEQAYALIAEHGPITSMEITELLSKKHGVSRTPGVVAKACRTLVNEARCMSRTETQMEQRMRQSVWPPEYARGGAAAVVYAVAPEKLDERRERADDITFAEPDSHSARAQSYTPEHETATAPAPTPTPTVEQVRTAAALIEQVAVMMESGTPTDERVEELELMVEMLEQENTRLRERLERFIALATES